MVVYRPYTIQYCTRAAVKASTAGFSPHFHELFSEQFFSVITVIMSVTCLAYSLEFKLEAVEAARETTTLAAAKSTKS